MNWQTFIKIIQENPNNTSFFPNTRNIELIGQSISAFFNSNGGNLIIGYDKVNVHLTGFDQSDHWVEEFIDRYFKQTTLTFSFLFRSNKKVLIFEIEKSKIPVAFNLKFYRFIDSKIEEFKPEPSHSNYMPSIAQNTLNPKSFSLSEAKPIENSVPVTISTKTNTLSQQILKEEKENNSSPLQEINKNNAIEERQTATNKITEITPSNPSAAENSSEKIKKDLNSRQINALKYIKENDIIKNKTYRKLFSVSHKTAHLELAELARLNIIQIVGSGRSTGYKLKENSFNNELEELSNEIKKINTTAPPKNIPPELQTKKNLIQSYLTNNSNITETVYAEIFNVDLAKAIEELQTLCEINVIEQTSINNETCYIKSSNTFDLSQIN